MPWSKRAVRSSEKRRILLTSAEFSADSRPVTERISAPPNLSALSGAANAAAGAKQRGQQQQQPSSVKITPVSFHHCCRHHHSACFGCNRDCESYFRTTAQHDRENHILLAHVKAQTPKTPVTPRVLCVSTNRLELSRKLAVV